MGSWGGVSHCAVPCCAAPGHAVRHHARVLPYLELGCLRTLQGALVPEPLVLGRGVADGSALQHQRVPLSQMARLRLPQDL